MALALIGITAIAALVGGVVVLVIITIAAADRKLRKAQRENEGKQ